VVQVPHLPLRRDGAEVGQITVSLQFFSKFFCLLLFEATFPSFVKDKKSDRSHKAVGIKGFLSIFA
jgi:hypothetical protein